MLGEKKIIGLVMKQLNKYENVDATLKKKQIYSYIFIVSDTYEDKP